MMNNEQLISFRKMVGLSQSEMACEIGYSLRQYQNLEDGKAEIRKCVRMACAAYALGIIDYDGPKAEQNWKRRKSTTNGNKKTQ